MMKLQYLIPLLLCATYLMACSGTRTVTTPLTDRDIVVDGTLTNWNLQSSVVERTDAVHYYAAHDNEFLYLFIDVRSLAQNSAMRQSGFIIYLSSSESQRKNIGLAFPAGTFNLLRDDPGAYRSFLNDREWSQKPENRRLMQNLEEEIFERVMIVEQTRGSDKNYGFVSKDQLRIDGVQIAAEGDRRLMGIELKVPLDESTVFNLQGNKLWLGFEIDPPNFRVENDNQMSSQRRSGRDQRVSRSTGNSQSNLRQRLGQYERWYKLNLDR